MPNLRKLRLGNNKFVTIDFVPNLPSLQKIDMKENQVAKVIEFGKLKFPNLFKIIVSANPCAEELGAGLKIDIIILFQDFNLKFINKEEITKEERDEAFNVKNERIKKEAEVFDNLLSFNYFYLLLNHHNNEIRKEKSVLD